MASGDPIPPHTLPDRPWITSLWFTATFLRDARISFSPGLNCIIGLNGTGKTTCIASARYLLGVAPEPGSEADHRSLLAANFAGGRAHLSVATERGLGYTVEGAFPDPARVLDASGNQATISLNSELFRAEFFSQTEIMEIAKDRNLQLALLDSFDSFGCLRIKAEIGDTIRALEDTERTLSRLDGLITVSSNRAAELPTVNAKLEGLEAAPGPNADVYKKALADRALRADERAFLDVSLAGADAVVRQLDEVEADAERRFAPPPKPELAGGANGSFFLALGEKASMRRAEMRGGFRAARAAADSFRDELRRAAEDLASLQAFGEAEFAELVKKHEEDRSIMVERARLAEERGKLLAVQLQHDEMAVERARVIATRNELLEKLDALRSELRAARKRVCAYIDERLAGRVRARIDFRKDRARFRDLLASVFSHAKQKTELIPAVVEHIEPRDLATMIRDDDVESIMKLDHATRNVRDRAVRFLHTIRTSGRVYELEALDLDDVPAIYLNTYGVWEEIAAQSHGQKTACILTVILVSSKNPLIMDQPEDHIDPHHLGTVIVTAIRLAKPLRQLIVVTLNANLPLLGEAERVIHLGRQTTHAGVDLTGTADELSETIEHDMDAGPDAFQARARAYGYVISNEKRKKKP